MKRRLETIEFTCDGCGLTQTWTGPEHTRMLPDGWGYRTVRNCGMTGYTCTEHLCPVCHEKHAERR